MQSIIRSRQSLGRREEGIALIVTLMVLMLVSALMVGFVTAIIADQRASGLDRDQTQAYAAAHAGLEQLTSDLSTLFFTDFSPTTAQIAALAGDAAGRCRVSRSSTRRHGGLGLSGGASFHRRGRQPAPEDPATAAPSRLVRTRAFAASSRPTTSP